jgi:hypothetical protein
MRTAMSETCYERAPIIPLRAVAILPVDAPRKRSRRKPLYRAEPEYVYLFVQQYTRSSIFFAFDLNLTRIPIVVYRGG